MSARCSGCGQENREGSKYCLRCGARIDVTPGGDPLLGRVLADRYRVLTIIGQGGMGRVYRAQQQLGTATRDVAIKVLHAEHSKDETLRKRLYLECEVVVSLTHPNTIQFHDFGELDDGRLFIVMELIEGESLGDALLAGPMPLARVERILVQIAGSLAEAHARGIVHRDLKPDNILLTTRGGEPDFVKVCDFGIAKRDPLGAPETSQLTMQGTVVGTPQYMSPEQLSGGELDARSDIYSLGLLVYEMLTGERPFSASSPLEWAARHTTAEPTPLESFPAARDLPEHTKRAVMRALAKLPAERQRTTRQLAAEVLGRGDASTPIGLDIAGPATPHEATAPTLHATPAARRKQSVDAEPLPTLPKARGRIGLVLAILLGGGLLAVGGAVALTMTSTPPDDMAAPIPDAGSAPRRVDAGHDAGHGPSEWIRIVHFEKRVSDAYRALGAPDGRYAVVHPGGTLGLELAAGTRIATDGTPGPDFYIDIDDARSGHYRADVAVAPRQHTIVGSELVGSLPLDADQFGIRRIRYIRIKNRSSQDLYVDAVGAYATAHMDDE